MGLLVASLGAVGCGGDDDEEGGKDAGATPDAGGDEEDAGGGAAGGGSDAGKDAGGGSMDSGTDSGGPAAVVCGGKTCAGHSTGASMFPAACAFNYQDAEVCGLDAKDIFGADSGQRYQEAHAKGVASASCGAFLDALDTLADGGLAPADAGTKGNGKQDRYLTITGLPNPVQLSTPGCCTPAGMCSGDTDNAEAILAPGSAASPSNGGFGCMNGDAFLRAVPEAARRKCDPTSGMIIIPPPADAGTDAGDGG
jgi:hypothetical protein